MISTTPFDPGRAGERARRRLCGALAALALSLTVGLALADDGSPINFAAADRQARFLVQRWDHERAAGRSVAEAAAVTAIELADASEFIFPHLDAPFLLDPAESAFTPDMAEALAIGRVIARAQLDEYDFFGLAPMAARLAARDDLPAWAFACREARLAQARPGTEPPAACGRVEEALTVGIDPIYLAVVRQPDAAPLGRVDSSASSAGVIIESWDRQRAAGLSVLEAATVLHRFDRPVLDLEALRAPLPADDGGWPIDLAESIPIAVRAAQATGHPSVGLGLLPAWHHVDPGHLDDGPALALRCRAARVDPNRTALHDGAAATCEAWAEWTAEVFGPLSPQAAQAWGALAALGRTLGEPGLAAAAESRARAPFEVERRGDPLSAADAVDALLALGWADADDRPQFLGYYEAEIAGVAPAWDREVASGVSPSIVGAALAKLSALDLGFGLPSVLLPPMPDGGAWSPAVVDGLVVGVEVGRQAADPMLAFTWSAAWAAADPGELDDAPAWAARCRAASVRAQVTRAVDPATFDVDACLELAERLEPGLGPLAPVVVGARARAVEIAAAMSDDVRGRAALEARDAPWPAPDSAATIAARAARAADVGGLVYRDEFVDFYRVDSLEVLDAWDQDLAAGLTARQAADAVSLRSQRWLTEMRWALTPPFVADAGAWPSAMVEVLEVLAEIGRQRGDPRLGIELLPALEAVAAIPDDVPSLSSRCRATQFAAQDGRPADDIDACEALTAALSMGLGDHHPWVLYNRVRLGDLYASRGERVAADEAYEQASSAWADPPSVDSTDEAVWALARVERRRMRSQAALGRMAQAVRHSAAARALADAVGYERVVDRTRWLAEEAALAMAADDRQAAVRLVIAARDSSGEMQAERDRRAAEDGAVEVEAVFAQEIARGLGEAETMLSIGLALTPFAKSEGEPINLSAFLAAWENLTRRGLEEHPLALEVLARLAQAQGEAGEVDAARESARRALALHARLDARGAPWRIYAAAAEQARAAGALSTAIGYAKAAVDATQQARRDVGRLGRGAVDDFVEANQDIYGQLAGLLIEAGRLAEVDATLTRLGATELAQLTRAAPVTADAPMPRSEAERAWAADLEAARADLRSASPWALPEARADFDAALDALEGRLEALSTSDGAEGSPADDAADSPAGPDETQERLGRLGRVALLRVVLDRKRAWLLLTTPTRTERAMVPIGRAEMNRLAHELYRALRGGGAHRAPAKRLYQALLGPIADALVAEGIAVLMVAPTGALRYVPFAALYDDTTARYAIERWAIVRYPLLAPAVLDRPFGPRDRVAAFGASEATPELAPLPHVGVELEGIVRTTPADVDGRISGRIGLDADFTEQRLRAALVDGVPLVHLASHFVFRPGSARGSYLALGAGRQLSLDRLTGPEFPLDRVELLTLSACETAVGMFAAGQPPDSFAELAMQSGAKSVLASLWPVADRSTAALMQVFYGHLAEGLSKAEALRRAQTALLRGDLTSGGAQRKITVVGAHAGPQARSDRASHPYAWAPFVLLGDWR